jgi:hypothetical protein
MNHNPGNMLVGSVRFNTMNQSMEVYDGINWMTMQPSHATVELNYEAGAALDWAKQKMEEEKELLRLIEKHPGLKELRDQFEMMKVLCMEEEKDNES